MPKATNKSSKFTTAPQFWTALSEKAQALIIHDLESILVKEIHTDPDYQVILTNYQNSYYAEEDLSQSEPLISWIARDYLQAIQARINQHLTTYYEEN